MVRDLILSYFTDLHEDDVRSTAMGQGGEDIQLSPKAREVMPYTIECKNVERLNLWKAWEQACHHKGDYNSLLFIKKNRSPVLAVLEAQHLMELIYGSTQLRQTERVDERVDSDGILEGSGDRSD